MIKIFKKKAGKSEKLVLSTREILGLYGITDQKTQDEVCNIFFRSNAGVMKAVLNKKDLDKTIEKETANMKDALIAAGITDTNVHDAIILRYYQIVLELAGVKQ